MPIDKQFTIFGYFNYGNYGDELLAELVEEGLKKQFPDSSIARLSSKSSFYEHWLAWRKSQRFYVLGGLLQDSTSLRSLLYYSLVIIIAKLHKQEVYLLGQGIGPLRSFIAKALVYMVCRVANKISVRDEASSQLLESLKIMHYYGSDLAWNLVPKLANYRSEKNNIIKQLFIAPRAIKANQHLLLDIIEQILEENKSSEVVILEMQNGDSDFIIQKFPQYKFSVMKANEYKVEDLICILRDSATRLVTMRLHALILGHIAGVDLEVIELDPKLRECELQINNYDLWELADRAERSLL